jgi:hypothetical protein
LAFWSGRSCTPEGAAAREVAALFLEYEVQSSPFPVTPAELVLANRNQRCDDRLDLSLAMEGGGRSLDRGVPTP